MIRPNKIHQDPPLGNDGSHHPGKREPKLQSYHGPHTLAQYHHSENPHQVFKAHMEKDHLYTKKASTRYYALSPVDSDYYSDEIWGCCICITLIITTILIYCVVTVWSPPR